MDIEGGWILDDDQVEKWKQNPDGSYDDYVASGLFYPDTNLLLDPIDWMLDDEIDGPWDFKLRPSQNTQGW